jgi:hypothetical protein
VSGAILLSEEEVHAITGYQKPALQLRELHLRGFHRARVNAVNRVVLERTHYEAVCAGATSLSQARERPRVLPPRGSQALGAI